MWSNSGNTYVPQMSEPIDPSSIEYVRENGVIVLISDDKKTATVETKKGLLVCYCAVTLNEDMTIKDFVLRPINKYVRITPEKK